MSNKQHIHENKTNKGPVPKAESVSNAELSDEQSVAHNDTGTSENLPQHRTTLAQRRQAILQLQRSRGNNFVMRQAMPTAMRQEDHAPAEAAAPSEISSGGNRVSTEGGVTIESGGLVRINSAITQTSGILQAGTIIADNVIASNYTPGAGNVM